MLNTTITSANAVLTLLVPPIYSTPFQIQGFASDKAFAMESIQTAEVNMGVDARLTAGFTPMPRKQTISLQADSPSKAFFMQVYRAMQIAKEVFYFSGNLLLTSTNESFTMTRGILTDMPISPDGQKVLQPMDFIITWESVIQIYTA